MSVLILIRVYIYIPKYRSTNSSCIYIEIKVISIEIVLKVRDLASKLSKGEFKIKGLSFSYINIFLFF